MDMSNVAPIFTPFLRLDWRKFIPNITPFWRFDAYIGYGLIDI